MPSDTKPQLRERSGGSRLVTRRSVITSLPLVAGLAGVGTASARPSFPDQLPLPTGFQPEGTTTGYGSEFFVGSLATGALYRGDYRTGAGTVVDTITYSKFDVPTTVAGFGRSLYAVNARFGIGDPTDAEYSILRVPR